MHDLYQPGQNCWRTGRADYVSILVDYGNYYRDLRESIIKARHSIFLLGWDIDSRIELLRGEDARTAQAPVKFFDLICWKAKQNPGLQVYLDRWDYSLFFMRQREPFAAYRWSSADLPNIHYCLDDVLPLAACHHQKIAVIDDEVAFWGGMDVALARWDLRQHHVRNRNRVDPAPLPHFNEEKPFAPYHDIQAVMAGPAVAHMSELVRMRWRAASRVEAIPAQKASYGRLPPTWPQSDPPDFKDVTVAIARTLPKTHAWPQTEEIAHLWPDEIARADNFIYIENQFLACPAIARALNARLRERQDLRVLAVSCYNPQGVMERKAMWAGRVRFRDIVEAGGVAGRVALAYPVCHENGKDAVVRVHSKLMIIDDRILHLGSANINNRSLGMDSECDVSLLGEDAAARAKIASVRNDLIREHTGREHQTIAGIVDGAKSVRLLLEEKPGSRQHLRPINDEAYRHERFARLAALAADPRRPIVPHMLTRIPRRGHARLRGRSIWVTACILLAVAGLALMWSHTPLADYASAGRLEALFEKIRNDRLAFAWVIGIYVLGGLVFAPVTALSGAVILVFGGFWGFLYSMAGSVASAAVLYAAGRKIGAQRLERYFPITRRIMKKLRDSGVIGVAVIRTLPIAPYTLVNLAFGVVGVSLVAYLCGTIIGLAPGKIMLAVFGDSLLDMIRHPNPKNIALTALGLAGWVGVALACNKMARAWEKKHPGKA